MYGLPLTSTPLPKRRGALLAAAALAAVMASAAQAAPIGIIGFQPGVAGQNCGTGNHSTFLGPGVTEFNFDGVLGSTAASSCSAANGPSSFFHDYGAMPAGPAGNLTFSGTGAAVVLGTTSTAGAPWADSTPYLSVPRPGTTGGSETVAINPALHDNYFGLYWGSIDTANTIAFTLSDGNTYSFNGSALGLGDVLSENAQNQTVTSTNEYVDFGTIAGLSIDSVTFSDGNSVAFEFDNLAYGTIDPVPEPASLALFGAALMGLGALRRRKRA